MKYKICVAIPIKSDDPNANTQLVETALEKSPDLIEFRFDYIKDIKLITIPFLKDLLKITPSNILKIFTFRSYHEGGKLNLKTDDHLRVLKLLVEGKPDYIDIEINLKLENLNQIINLAYENEVRLILSYHNFDRTISYKEVTALLNNFNNKLMHDLLIGLDKVYGCVYKIILTAQHFDDNVIALNICKKLSQQEIKFVCFAMSDLGVLSRILCVNFGSLWTYGSLVEKTAPGQIKIEKIREIHQLLFEN
ncbi:MAG: type I 3-dehydroquinate dehydratase [Candidatus Lokiarchaeota archaeon]|nr:type I 3-dehydroquinate dehydratase [Candidatus Lokiarchaeota archaeon]